MSSTHMRGLPRLCVDVVRLGDGRVTSGYLNIGSPIPIVARNLTNIQDGINFAHGGTGVFDTHVDGPNLTAQIDFFEELIQSNLFTKEDIHYSYVLVNAGANDYTTHIRTAGFFGSSDILNYTSTLVNQIKTDLRRFISLGLRKVAVATLQPVGRLPLITLVNLHMSCIDLLNKVVSENHNKLLNNAIDRLNMEARNHMFIPLDLYKAMVSNIDIMMKKAQDDIKHLS
ncbi:hypothetical protein PIB30_059660 [Stylosanthes scabra]|uniref:SGNH hydrolase-type esterase domain-containing protein n=1 Tax=Stylosanthes scabra TaxID=79078 RepID=A0ABU6TMR5_9FABA|nr:hypothetical protein [Stylosanthes scabra]